MAVAVKVGLEREHTLRALEFVDAIWHIAHLDQGFDPARHAGDAALVAKGLEGEVAVVVALAGGADTTKRSVVHCSVEEGVVAGGTARCDIAEN